MDNHLAGSCHCGAVAFELTGKPKLVVNCHCDDCKKRNGSAFSTYIAVAADDLRLIRGEPLLKKYAVENVGIKYFCADCGSPLYNENFRYPGMYMVFYGSCAEQAKLEPAFNVFCESRHDWVNAIDGLRSFQQGIER